MILNVEVRDSGDGTYQSIVDALEDILFTIKNTFDSDARPGQFQTFRTADRGICRLDVKL